MKVDGTDSRKSTTQELSGQRRRSLLPLSITVRQLSGYEIKHGRLILPFDLKRPNILDLIPRTILQTCLLTAKPRCWRPIPFLRKQLWTVQLPPQYVFTSSQLPLWCSWKFITKLNPELQTLMAQCLSNFPTSGSGTFSMNLSTNSSLSASGDQKLKARMKKT